MLFFCMCGTSAVVICPPLVYKPSWKNVYPLEEKLYIILLDGNVHTLRNEVVLFCFLLRVIFICSTRHKHC